MVEEKVVEEKKVEEKEVVEKLGLPIILKPADLGSSVGIKVVKTEETPVKKTRKTKEE